MRTSHYPPLARAVQQQTIAFLRDHLRPQDFSNRCTASVLLGCLILAAVARISLAAVAALRSRCPSRETLRQALLSTLPDYQELLRRLPGLLRASLPRGLRRMRCRYPMVIDLHPVAYFKRDRTPPAHVRKGSRRPGTVYGHQYASASLLRKGQYYIVALTPYAPGESLAEVAKRLLRQAAGNGFSPRFVLMDRSFWVADVFRYMQRARYPFLLPVLGRGKRPEKPGGPTGTQRFLHGLCRSGTYPYQISNRRGQKATLTIVVQRRNRAGRRGKHGRYTWAYGMWRMKLRAIAWVRESYRRRFRIESSYRLLEAARGRTSSRDEGWRLWYVVLAVLLVNHWLAWRREWDGQRRKSRDEWHWWNRLLVAMIFLLMCEPAQPPEASETAKSPDQK